MIDAPFYYWELLGRLLLGFHVAMSGRRGEAETYNK